MGNSIQEKKMISALLDDSPHSPVTHCNELTTLKELVMGRMRAPEGTFTLYRRKNGYWYYWTYDRYSTRHHRSTGVKNKQLAMKVCIQRTQDGTLLSDLGVKKYITLGEFSKDFFLYDSCPYIQSRLARGFLYSRKTAANNRYYLETYIWKTFGNRILEMLSILRIRKSVAPAVPGP